MTNWPVICWHPHHSSYTTPTTNLLCLYRLSTKSCSSGSHWLTSHQSNLTPSGLQPPGLNRGTEDRVTIQKESLIKWCPVCSSFHLLDLDGILTWLSTSSSERWEVFVTLIFCCSKTLQYHANCQLPHRANKAFWVEQISNKDFV